MADEKYWIALNRVKGIGLAQLKEVHRALEHTGLELSDIIDLTEDEIRGEFTFNDRVISALGEAQSYLEDVGEVYSTLLENNISIIPFFSASYPEMMVERLGNGAPSFLYCTGNTKLMYQKPVALLGDRNISSRGEMITYMAARELTRHSIPILSGMSTGTGVVAHRSALENGGTTIAVIPSGILEVKLPQFLQEVYNPDSMLIVSPFYPDTQPDKYHAFHRNRVIAAMSKAVYIIEAPTEGGIFEGAKSAHDLKVPLYTTEYSTWHESSRGNQRILKELQGKPVRGRMIQDTLTPNMDAIIAEVKF